MAASYAFLAANWPCLEILHTLKIPASVSASSCHLCSHFCPPYLCILHVPLQTALSLCLSAVLGTAVTLFSLVKECHSITGNTAVILAKHC